MYVLDVVRAEDQLRAAPEAHGRVGRARGDDVALAGHRADEDPAAYAEHV